MKGVILAGGTGSRLFPLTKATNKHLLPVGNEPMIYHPIRKLTEAGITDILIVTSTDHMGDVVRCLGSGKDFGCSFTYKVQDESGGIAQALGLAENFCKNERFCVILGDNIFESSLTPFVTLFQYGEELVGSAMILTHKVPDPTRYGVVEINECGEILGIEEKPTVPKSDHIVTGIYFYDSKVFDIIRLLRPSARGELEITDVNNHYINAGLLEFCILTGWWTDAGTFESLGTANELIFKTGGL